MTNRTMTANTAPSITSTMFYEAVNRIVGALNKTVGAIDRQTSIHTSHAPCSGIDKIVNAIDRQTEAIKENTLALDNIYEMLGSQTA